jgi:predicted metal-binding protein
MESKTLRDKFLRCRSVTDLSQLDNSRIEDDLAKYTKLAQELSVDDTAIINRENFLIDPKVRLKCRVPLCRHYGTCMNCPPHTLNVGEVQNAINSYQTGILLRWVFPKEKVLGSSSDIRRDIFDTISIIESAAFYDGYYLACGFATGSCRSGLCKNMDCQALTTSDKGCRHPLLARPSMEAMSLDAYGMAARAGWEIYPAGKNCPEQIDVLNRIGIVLIV